MSLQGPAQIYTTRRESPVYRWMGWDGWREYQKCTSNFPILCGYIENLYTYLYIYIYIPLWGQYTGNNIWTKLRLIIRISNSIYSPAEGYNVVYCPHMRAIYIYIALEGNILYIAPISGQYIIYCPETGAIYNILPWDVDSGSLRRWNIYYIY